MRVWISEAAETSMKKHGEEGVGLGNVRVSVGNDNKLMICYEK
jgi:hypothetical protein